MHSQAEIDERINKLAKEMVAKRLAFSESMARERARDIIMQELKSQEMFEKVQFDPAKNPQQRTNKVSPELLKTAGGMLTGNELPENVPLSELLKGKKPQK